MSGVRKREDNRVRQSEIVGDPESQHAQKAAADVLYVQISLIN